MAVVYTTATLSLAALESLVHVKAEDTPGDLVAVAADIPSRLAIRRISAGDLPASWRAYPAPPALAKIGAEWVNEAKAAVLAVPSAAVPEEVNYILNPAHPDFRKIRVGRPRPFSFDPRLWGPRSRG